MKLNKLTIYAIVIVIFVAALIIGVMLNKNSSKEAPGNLAQKEMPNDEVHKGLKNGAAMPQPGKQTEEMKHQIAMIQKTVEDNPNDTMKIRQFADVLAQGHQPEEAIKYYEMILKKDPKRADILFSLSYIYYIKTDLNKSADYLLRILKFDKSNLNAVYNLGLVEATRGNNTEARKYWESIVKQSPSSELGKLAADALKKLQ
ncbi:MAG: tetratricopeptide repeat protein [Ignavibacteria bacterium]|nr:tetratricopeptide repeat protein [Ignavibacteria bacterium]